MARPKSPGRSDLKNVVEFFGKTQEARFAVMDTFAKQLESKKVQEQVRKDDHLFSTILQLAFNEYGVRQNLLTARLDLSSGVLSRWSNKVNLPASLMRPAVVQVIADVIHEDIERQKADNADLLSGRVIN